MNCTARSVLRICAQSSLKNMKGEIKLRWHTHTRCHCYNMKWGLCETKLNIALHSDSILSFKLHFIVWIRNALCLYLVPDFFLWFMIYGYSVGRRKNFSACRMPLLSASLVQERLVGDKSYFYNEFISFLLNKFLCLTESFWHIYFLG